MSREPAAVTDALRDLREHRLALPLPRGPVRHLAFSRGRLARALKDAVVLYDLYDGAEVLRAPLNEPRALTRLSDGSLLAVGRDVSLRFAPGSKQGVLVPKVTLFPGSTLLADLAKPGHLWVLHAGDASLYDYLVEPGPMPLLPPSRKVDLPAFDGRAFAQLADGAFVYTADAVLVRVYPGGRPARLRLPETLERVERLLPDRRLDRVWALASKGFLALLQLEASNARLVATRELDADPFDLTAAAGTIAAVYVERDQSGPRFRLVVFDADGGIRTSRVQETSLAGAGPEWASRLIENLRLELERKGRFLALGGVETLHLWDLRKRGELFQMLPRQEAEKLPDRRPHGHTVVHGVSSARAGPDSVVSSGRAAGRTPSRALDESSPPRRAREQ